MLGSKIAVIKATDADGTAPGNIVNYEFIPERSNEKAETYFNLDRESGEITVINDLTKEVFDEYVLEIRAVDQGNPPLESSLTMIIRIQQVLLILIFLIDFHTLVDNRINDLLIYSTGGNNASRIRNWFC